MTTNSLQSMDRQPHASAYQWLEESLRRMSVLQKDSHPQQYGEELKNLVKESVQRLNSSDASDLLLQVNLRLLAAEALIDLALVEEDTNQRSGYLQAGHQHCRQIIDLLKTQPVSGLACETLPRLITLLACASQAAAEQHRQPLLDDLQTVVDLLEGFLDQQANERQQAGDELLRGQVYVSSRTAWGNDAQTWRMVLGQAADCVRRAGALAYRAFDFELFNHSQESLAEIEKLLAVAQLAAPALAVSTRAQAAAVQPAAPKKSRGRLLLGVGGLLLSCLLSLFSLFPLLQGFGLLGKSSVYLPAFLAGQPDDRLVAEENLPDLVLSADELPQGWLVEKNPYSGSTNLEWGGEEQLAYFDSIGRITDITIDYTPPGEPCDLDGKPLKVYITTHIFKESAGADDFFHNESEPGENQPRFGEQSAYRAFVDKKGFHQGCNTAYTSYVFTFQRFNTVTEIIMQVLDGSMTEKESRALILDLGKKVDERILSVAE